MKATGNGTRRSPFWSRLLGLLITFAIVAVLVFGGVKNLMGELSAAYDAFAASQMELAHTQSELAVAKNELGATQGTLATAQYALDIAQDKLEGQTRALRRNGQDLDQANDEIQVLTEERDDLKRGLHEAVSALAESDQTIEATDSALRTVEAELERYLQQPKLSVIVTTERQFAMSQRERFAASQVLMFVDSDAGTMFYDGREALHEFEQHMVYAERTQVVVTQTGPGQDVLECLNDGCAMIVAAQSSAMRMETYAYQSQYVGMESLLWME